MTPGAPEHLILARYKEDFPEWDAASLEVQFLPYLRAYVRARREARTAYEDDLKVGKALQEGADELIRRLKKSAAQQYDSEERELAVSPAEGVDFQLEMAADEGFYGDFMDNRGASQ